MLVLVDCVPAAAGGWNTLDICNDGNTTVRVAIARQVRGFLSNGRKLIAWWPIEPGACEQVFAYDSSESANAFITFLYRDLQNRDGVVLIGRPEDDRVFDQADKTFCVNMTGDFTTESDVHETCPTHYPPPEFQTVTFPIFFMATALDDSEGASRQTLRLSPDVNRRSAGLILQWGPTARTAPAASERPASPARPAGPSSAPPVARGVFAPVPAEKENPAPTAWWASLVGTWSGTTTTGGTERTITLDLNASGGELKAFVRTSDGLTGDARARIVSGSREVVARSESQITFDGRLSSDGKTIDGQLNVWFWTPKAVTLALTKR
jgi:hypothetical protein